MSRKETRDKVQTSKDRKKELLDWSVKLLSTACTKKMLENATDRDPGVEFSSHRYGSYLLNSTPDMRSLDRYSPSHTGALISIGSLTRPQLMRVGELMVINIWGPSRYLEPDGSRKYVPVVDTVTVPWCNTYTGEIGPVSELVQRYNARQIVAMREVIAGALHIPKEQFEQRLKHGFRVTW